MIDITTLGYDYITSAIGSILMAYHGATFFYYLPPSPTAKNLRLLTLRNMKEDLIAAKITTHTADAVKKLLSTAGFRLGTDIHPSPEFRENPSLPSKIEAGEKRHLLYVLYVR